MVCIECGKSNGGDSKFCKECGARLTGAAMPSFIPVSGAAVVSEDEQADSVKRLLDMAFWHSDSGNVESAIRACRAALVIQPECTSALSLLGCLYEREGDIGSAIDAIERVVQLNPASVADTEKLELLKNGIHPGAVTAPRGYRWIPPAMLAFFIKKPYGPALGAGIAAAGVLACGLGVLTALMSRHPSADRTSSHVTLASPSGAARPALVATGGTVPVRVAAAPTETAAPSPADSSIPETDPRDTRTDRSPFGSIPNAAVTYSRGAVPTNLTLPVMRRRQDRMSGLPSVAAVKPIDFVPRASAADVSAVSTAVAPAVIPEHTIVVSPAAAVQPAASVSPAPRAEPSPPPASRIEIHFYAPDDPEATAPARTTARADRASDLQSRALKLQSQGDYSGAMSAYRSAIAAYKADVASGRSSDFAKRGIDACETGVQICKQNQ